MQALLVFRIFPARNEQPKGTLVFWYQRVEAAKQRDAIRMEMQ